MQGEGNVMSQATGVFSVLSSEEGLLQAAAMRARNAITGKVEDFMVGFFEFRG